ncbi:PAS domain S-box-containing protein [Bradyrhizobium sp. USDA 372]
MDSEPIVDDLKRQLAAAHAEIVELRGSPQRWQTLRAEEEKYRAMFDLIDEGFCIVEVIEGEREPIDYRFLETNASFERQTGLVGAVGRRMRELEPEHEEHWFERYSRIARTRTPERFEDRADALGRWYDVYAFPVGAPEQRRVGILFRDVIERKRAEQQQLLSNKLLRTTVDSSLQMIQLFKAVRDEHDTIVDFEWLLTNKKWNERWGSNVGKRLLTENPAAVESGVWGKFLEVMETGAPITHEHFYRQEQFDGWFLQTIAKADDGILLSTLDITDQKLTEAALRNSEAEYRMLFEGIGEGFCLCERVAGEPVDYRYLAANPGVSASEWIR